jgi:hypothetical protein
MVSKSPTERVGEPDFVCTVAIVPVDLPASDFYEIEIGRRGSLSFTAEELADDDYYVELSLGEIE